MNSNKILVAVSMLLLILISIDTLHSMFVNSFGIWTIVGALTVTYIVAKLVLGVKLLKKKSNN